MLAPTVTVPLTGTDPKVADLNNLLASINAATLALNTAREGLGVADIAGLEAAIAAAQTTAANMATAIGGAADKAAPVSIDTIAIKDSAAGGALKEATLGSLPVSTAVAAALNGKATAAQGALADTAVQPAVLAAGLATKAEASALDGKADLVGGKVSASQLPAFVDDVIEAANFAALPASGETGKIYVTLNDNKTYRWSGSAYAEISASLALGETSATAYRGDRGKLAYDFIASATAAIAAKQPDIIVHAAGALVFDDYANVLLVPAFEYQIGGNASVAVTPAEGMYFEQDISDQPTEGGKVTYYDTGDAALGTNTFSAIKGTLQGGDRFIVAQHKSGAVIGNQISVAETVANTIPKRAWETALSGATTYPSGTAMSSLISALGVEQLYTEPDGNVSVGVNAPEANYYGNFFVRVFVQLGAGETAKDWPAITVNSLSRNIASGFAASSRGSLTLEKVYGDRVASFVARQTLSDAQNHWGMQVAITGQNGRDIRMTQPQVAYGKQPNLYVQPNDWPDAAPFPRLSPASLLFPPAFHMIEGRSQTIYPGIIRKNRRIDGQKTSFMVPNNGTIPPFSKTSRDAVVIDPARVLSGQNMRILAYEDEPFADWQVLRDAVLTVTPLSALSGQTVNLACVGDSKTDVYPGPSYVGTVLAACGVTVSFVGTMDPAALNEGRSGRDLLDYTGKTVGLLPVGGSGNITPAAYLALTDTEKRAYNPFIRPEVGTEAGAYNNYIFDYADYLAKFSLPTSGVFVLNMGTNDIGDYDDHRVLRAEIIEAAGVIVPSVLAAGYKVILASDGDQFSSVGQNREYKREAVTEAFLRYADDLDDPDVIVAPTWAVMNPADSSNTGTDRVDPYSGATTRLKTDDVHPVLGAVRQYAECVAASVATLI